MIADRWGVTAAEVGRPYACDDYVTDPDFTAWRAVTIEATAGAVWPWITQITVAPYSYDWIDNLGRRSPQRLLDLPDPVPGQPFTRAGGRSHGRVLAVVHANHFTGVMMGVAMTYQLIPDGHHTRLVLKLTGMTGHLIAPLLSVGDLLMARRQLLNLKHLAEHHTGN